MFQRQELAKALKHIAIGYLFIHVHLTIVTVDILPNWVGWILFLGAFGALAQITPEVEKLRTLGMILGFWAVVCWIINIFNPYGTVFLIVGVVFSVLNLYFQFKFLTHISDVAGYFGCGTEREKLLTIRNVLTVLGAILAIPIWHQVPVLAFLLALVCIIVIIWLIFVLFSVKRVIEDTTL